MKIVSEVAGLSRALKRARTAGLVAGLAALAMGLSLALPKVGAAAEGEPELIHLYQYKPIYFLLGNPYAKLQLSLKSTIVRSLPVYVAFTQLLMWDLFVYSPYFHDINYDPEVFYRWSLSGGSGNGDRWVDLGAFEHESNGRGGTDERSWNRSYLRYHARTSVGARAKLIWDLKAWLIWYAHENNPHIGHYRGAWEVTLTLTDFLGPFFELGDLSLRLYPGGASTTNPFLGGQELTFRAKSGFREFLPVVVAQVFHGYGENLLDEERDHWGFRVGLGF